MEKYRLLFEQLHSLTGSILAELDAQKARESVVLPTTMAAPAIVKPASGFKFSNRSRRNLEGVDEKLIAVTTRALAITSVDFTVIEGRRTLERQKQLLAQGATQTLNSQHLSGDAVDLGAIVDGKITFKPEHEEAYFKVADAMIQAASELDLQMRWGAAWSVHDTRKYAHTATPAYSANHDYVWLRQSQNRQPFIDMVHHEITPEHLK